MSLVYNGTEITDVTYNGTELTKVTYNGTVVFEKQSAPVMKFVVTKPTGDTLDTGLWFVDYHVGQWTTMPSIRWSDDDGETWNTAQPDDLNPFFTINTGGTYEILVKGNNTHMSESASVYTYFCWSGGATGTTVEVDGEIMALLGNATTIPSYGLNRLFSAGILDPGQNPMGIASTCTMTVTSIGAYGCQSMFSSNTNVVHALPLVASQLATNCYENMFYNCGNLEELPKLTALAYYNQTCKRMFYNCSKIKLSTTKTGDYQTAYRIPMTGTGTTSGSNQFQEMFTNTGGTKTGTASINTTYYTSNTLV